MRRPQRVQRRSSSSFQAWQWTHCILVSFIKPCYPRLLQWAFLRCLLSTDSQPQRTSTLVFGTILQDICHAFCFMGCFAFPHLGAQVYRPALPPPSAPPSLSANPDQKVKAARPGAPDAEHVHIESVTQDAEGVVRHLRGNVR